jgi:uronate dehydrogenase
MLSTWLSPEDCFALVKAVFDAPRVGCLMVYGVSANRDVWWNNDHAAVLGWRPRDSSERFRARVEAEHPPEDPRSPGTIFQGGKFVAAGHFED